MSGARPRAARWRAAAGLFAAPAAWAVHHQAGAYLNFSECQPRDSAWAIGIGLAALAITVLGGLMAWSVWRRRGGLDGSEGNADRFLAALSLLVSALFGLTIGVQILAAFVVPACFR